jgi:glycerol uptake facilitator-like aquaporin
MASVAVATRVPPQSVPLAATHVSGITKVAVTFTSAVMETVQLVFVPVQPPDQLANANPSVTVGVAVRVTLPLPGANSPAHVVPLHVSPGAGAVTVPVPSPARATFRA